jgi:hypothetical protein
MLMHHPGISRSTVFGMPALKVARKVFAAYAEGILVVKLPRERLEALVASGSGIPFVRHGKTMRGWVAVAWETHETWHRLAEEAMVFVSGS